MQPRLVTYRRAGKGIARFAWVLEQHPTELRVVELGTRERRVLDRAEVATVADYREPRIVAPHDVRAMVLQ